MDANVQRLQIESLKAQLSLMQLSCAYLAGRCASPDAIAEETWELLELLEHAGSEAKIARYVLGLLRGSYQPMWG
jgi:hypothetical protein